MTWKFFVLLHATKVNMSIKSGHLLHVDVEGSLGLALGTRSRLHLLSLRLEERPQHKAALVTVVLDHAELREHASAAADHTTGPDELVEVELPGPQREREEEEELKTEATVRFCLLRFLQLRNYPSSRPH